MAWGESNPKYSCMSFTDRFFVLRRDSMFLPVAFMFIRGIVVAKIVHPALN